MIIVWIFVSGIYSEFFRWGILEMQERYINPSKIGYIYSYQMILNEVGILTGILLLTLYPHVTLTQLSTLTWVTLLVTLSTIYFIFLNPRTLEIHHIKVTEPPVWQLLTSDKFCLTYLLLGLSFGLFKVSQDTLANGYFQNISLERIDIQNYISIAMLIGSLFQIVTSYLNGKIVEKNRISPISTINVSWILYFIAALTCVYYNSLISYILFLSCSKGFAGIYYPNTSRISGAYENTKKTALRTLHFWGAVILTAAVFYFIPPEKSNLVLLLICAFIATVFLNYILKKQHTSSLEKLILSHKLADSIRAAIGLSYLKPDNYILKMEDILNKNPDKLLRKQIILGLGHTHANKSTDRLIQEFNSDKEEIQMTVIEALKLAKGNKATKFALDLVLSNRKTLTPRVRLNASQIIVALYGEKSIPILMLGFQEDDPRMIANVIEALSQFKNSELIETYKKYSQSKTPRIKANALIALLKYPDQKQDVFSQINATLDSEMMDQLGEKISIFYVIGRNKVHMFKDKLLKLYDANSKEYESYKNLDPLALSYTQTLSWALLRLNEAKGFQSLLKLLDEISDPAKLRSLLHFYVQLEDVEKFDCIDYWMMYSKNKSLTQRHLIEMFQSSGFDFTDEISYLNSLKSI